MVFKVDNKFLYVVDALNMAHLVIDMPANEN